MKTGRNLRLAVAAMIAMVFTSVVFSSCKKEDADYSIIGMWCSTDRTTMYRFDDDGRGVYEGGGGIRENFTYTTSPVGYDGGTIGMKFTYYNDGYVSHSYSSGSYRIYGDTLRLSLNGRPAKFYIRSWMR